MQRPYITLMTTACALVLFACSFSAGTKKDFATGLSHTYKGFAVEEVLLVGPDNVAMSDNEVVLNTKVAIVAQGITNYELKDGKAFPGLMLSLTDKSGTLFLTKQTCLLAVMATHQQMRLFFGDQLPWASQ